MGRVLAEAGKSLPCDSAASATPSRPTRQDCTDTPDGHAACCSWPPELRGDDLLFLFILNDEAALDDLVEQRLVADLEQASRLRAVPMHAVEHFLDGDALGVTGGLTRDLLDA